MVTLNEKNCKEGVMGQTTVKKVEFMLKCEIEKGLRTVKMGS